MNPTAPKEWVDACQFHRWYDMFRHITPRSSYLELSDSFMEYLGSNESVFVSPSIQEEQGARVNEYEVADAAWSDEDEVAGEDDAGGNAAPVYAPFFEEVETWIKETTADLGGSVVPKLNWSSPRDATWIAFDQSLKCSTPNDVFLLLKSSDFVSHDLEHAYEGTTDADEQTRPDVFVLVLRRWASDLVPSNEFRCFVRNGHLVAISQRHHENYYPHLAAAQGDLCEAISRFYQEHISGVFPCDQFTMDVYMDGKNRVRLLDFNPWVPYTDTLLYTWAELETASADGESAPMMRVVTSQQGVVPSLTMYSRLPKDLIQADELLLQSDAVDMDALMKLVRDQQNDPGLDDQ